MAAVPLRVQTTRVALLVACLGALLALAVWSLRLLQAMTAWPY